MRYAEPSVTGYYSNATRQMEEEVVRERDDSPRLRDRESYEQYLFSKYSWSEIEFSGGPEIKASSDKKEVSDGFGRRVIDTVFFLTIRQPVKPDRNIPTILKHIGSTYTPGPLDFEYKNGYLVRTIRAGDWDEAAKKKAIDGVIADMAKEIERRNADIRAGNQSLKAAISKIVDWKMTEAAKNRAIKERLEK